MARFRFPLSNKGTTLIEVMVAAATSVIVAAAASFVLVLAVETYTRMVRQYEAESEMATAMLAVSATLSNSQKMLLQGTVGGAEGGTSHDLKTNRTALNGAGAADPSYVTRGHLMGSFDATSVAGTTHLLAMGVTESGNRTNRSNLTAFGIFYQRPTETSAGAIYIDKERNANGWTAVSPLNARQSFSRFTYFGVTDIRTRAANGGIAVTTTEAQAGANRLRPVLSANFVFQMRYFTYGKAQDFFWCPPAGMTAACTTKSQLVGYRDIIKNLKVVFPNQEMVDYNNNNSTYLAERMYGRTYFFKFLPSIK